MSSPAEAVAGDPRALRAAAVAMLARRDFASLELRARLISQGFEAHVAEAVLAELSAEGAVDDERYAQNYVAYHAGRGQGPIRIAAQLRCCGVPEGIIAAALAGGPDWRALATKVCRARFGARPAASWGEKARRARFLQYRGFSADHIRVATGVETETGLTDP